MHHPFHQSCSHIPTKMLLLLLDVVWWNTVGLLTLIKMYNSLFFSWGIYLIYLLLVLPDHILRIKGFVCLWGLLKGFPGNNWLFFQYKLCFSCLNTILFCHEFFCALEILIFKEIACFWDFSTFWWIFFVQEGSITFSICLVNLINFIL